MEFAYSALRDKVWAGELPPGTRLVNRALGKELGVSTVTVREAIHRLASEGLVEHVPNAGAYVRDLDRKEMVDLLVLRSNLDCFVVQQAAPRIAEHQLMLLEAICGEWRSTIEAMRRTRAKRLDGEPLRHWLELDARFHSLLVEAADNSWLTKVVNDINLNAQVMRTKAPYLTFSDAVNTYRHHASITRALRKHDVGSVCHWMRVHGEASLTYLLQHIDDIRPPNMGSTNDKGPI